MATTEQELLQLEQEAQQSASTEIPQRRFGSRVTPQIQQQFIQRRESGEQALQQIRQFRQEQVKLKQEQDTAEVEYQRQKGEAELLNLAFEERSSGLGSGLSYFYGRPELLERFKPMIKKIDTERHEAVGAELKRREQEQRRAEIDALIKQGAVASGVKGGVIFKTPTGTKEFFPSSSITGGTTYTPSPLPKRPTLRPLQEPPRMSIGKPIQPEQKSLKRLGVIGATEFEHKISKGLTDFYKEKAIPFFERRAGQAQRGASKAIRYTRVDPEFTRREKFEKELLKKQEQAVAGYEFQVKAYEKKYPETKKLSEKEYAQAIKEAERLETQRQKILSEEKRIPETLKVYGVEGLPDVFKSPPRYIPSAAAVVVTAPFATAALVSTVAAGKGKEAA